MKRLPGATETSFLALWRFQFTFTLIFHTFVLIFFQTHKITIMSFLSKLFSKGANDLIKSGGNVIDKIATSDEEKMKAKNELSKHVFDALGKIQEGQREVLLSETRGNWLQRSWRPILMLAFGFIVIYAYFIEPAFFLGADETGVAESLNDNFWGLLKLGIGGYIIGRSTEKVAGTVTNRIDMPFLRKKDRKNIYG